MTDGTSEGGKARALKLSSEERKAIAIAGAQARWAKADPGRENLSRAICGSVDKPLMIGDIEIPCYVLDDERRVLTVAGMSRGMAMAQGGSMVRGLNRFELFISRDRIKPFVSASLAERIHSPIIFLTTSGGKAYGYEAEVLVELCEAVLAAREARVLQKQQEGIAHRCELLVRGLARVGIVALVDEVTGYQQVRARDALHKILEAYIAPELLPWTKRFPNEFYVELYRLLNWSINPLAAGKPGYVGTLTNSLVYDKLPPGVVDELRLQNPVNPDTKRRRYKHHQFLSEDIGNPHLEKHISQVIALMRASDDWHMFKRLFRRAFPDPQRELDLRDGDFKQVTSAAPA
ncbi:hypothetical protein SAE02_76390 [Skermanella aerolata]|uniref:Bacteriophage Mx8 p63 C-terminal domain-containing protein n=1 Tax=Skermanella aerolata TaxID=393310 RepID=A0A512E435_9PROT|nr:P63C domain-containing protein [Skermanella aerolata]KJB90006.1 hypothetical protein N826_08710 [Skermanella aerolata KACC 11604]GEO43491.1 hypothetical protein SAE02_76390 [Skermanella aerolata]